MKIAQMVTVDRWHDEIVVASMDQATTVFWNANGWLRRLPADTADAELGTVVVAALEVSRQDVEPPSGPGKPFDFVLRELGVDSFDDYAAEAISTTVRLDRTAEPFVIVTPFRSMRDGFTPMSDKKMRSTDVDALAIGRLVRRAGLEVSVGHQRRSVG